MLDEAIDLQRVPETCRIGRRFEVTQGNVVMIDIVEKQLLATPDHARSHRGALSDGDSILRLAEQGGVVTAW